MKNLATILALILGLGLVVMGCVGDADDDDSSNAADDDAGDDDSMPIYDGEIDLANSALSASCVVTVASVEGGPTPEGYFEFAIEVDGWAVSMWVELWDLTSQYCEGYNPGTGDACVTGEYERPGWSMDNVTFGWNQTDGFWDFWELYLEYYQELSVAHPAGKSIFICENAGSNFVTHFCGCDLETEECFCTEFPISAWE